MIIREERIRDVTLLSVTGEFDARTAPQAHAKLDGLFEELRTRLVFNLSGVEIVTSTAISFLIDAGKRTRKLGGDAVLSQPSQLLMKSLRSLDIGEYFLTFDSDGAACAHFENLTAPPAGSAGSAGAPPPDDPKRPWWRLGK